MMIQSKGWRPGFTLGMLLICACSGGSEPSRTDQTISAGDTGAPSSKTPTIEYITLSSNAFENNGPIPEQYTCDGADISPPIAWGMLPVGTKTIVLLCESAVDSGSKYHWVVYNIPPRYQRDLPARTPPGAVFPNEMRQGRNDFGDIGYRGPCLASGTGQRLIFRLYALNSILHLPDLPDGRTVLAETEGRVIGEGMLTGTYNR